MTEATLSAATASVFEAVARAMALLGDFPDGAEVRELVLGVGYSEPGKPPSCTTLILGDVSPQAARGLADFAVDYIQDVCRR